jgi:NTE family protein
MRFLRVIPLWFGFLAAGACLAQQTAARPKIGVALEGGGAKGLAHIGVLKWFEDHHIPIDYIAGTSMGGLIGGLYATGYSPDEIARIVKEVDWDRVMAGRTDYPDLSFRRKEDLRALPNRVEFGLRGGIQTPGGLNSGQEVRLIIDRYVLPYSAVASFDMLPTPFRCVATDLVSGKEVVFRDGSLPDALRATMSIPGVFSPVKQDGKVLADGGLLNNLPTDVVKQMGADIVIGVHLSTGPVTPQNLTSLFQVAGGASDVMIGANEMRGIEHADILVTIDVAGYSTLDFSRAEKIIPLGVTAAENKAALLSRLSDREDDWNRYTVARDSRKIKDAPTASFIEVTGTSPNVSKGIQEELTPLIGKPLDAAPVTAAFRREVGVGRLNSLSYDLVQRNGATGLIVNAEEKDYAPPWIKPSISIDGADPKNVQFTFGGRITALDVGGYRSELRTDFAIGSSYLFAMEYFHPFTPTTRWFVAPSVNIGHSPINLYSATDFLAEYKVNQGGGGLDLGYSINRFSEIRLGYEAGYEKIYRYVGSPLLPTVSGRTGEARIRYALDRLDNPIIPRRGVAVLGSSGYIDSNPGAKKGIPVAQLQVQGFLPLGKRSSVYSILDGGTTFGVGQTGIPLYSLGGPSRLAAYGINEFLTDRYLYGRLGYLRQIAKIPPFIGSGLYLDAHYELAATNSLFSKNRLPNDGVVGVIAETVLGPLLIGGSVGDSGHRKWFFQFGRVF